MCTEAFRKIELPPCYKYSKETGWNLAVLNDSLAFIWFRSRNFEQPSRHSEHSLDIWVMMEYGIEESWVKKYSIQPFSLSGRSPLRTFAPWCFWNSDILLFQSENGHFLSCSRKDNNCQEICKYDVCGYACLEALVYEETLVSLAGISNGLYWKKM
ncbi:hypothetical protein ACH5RR_037938 [Cinchona calisaya]|uniref:Uncharacterized protein n=1 Tax=Cinchona calisaya TaxID=153742 RepID=A0ABD2Y7L7_9GENT